MKALWRISLLSMVVFLPTALFGQATTGNFTGTVTSGGKALPGVLVTVTSRSLQGVRTAATGEAGGYAFPNLPPGDYTATFEQAGMQTARKRVTVDVSTTSHADVDMKVLSITEAITVTASAPAAESTRFRCCGRSTQSRYWHPA